MKTLRKIRRQACYDTGMQPCDTTLPAYDGKLRLIGLIVMTLILLA